jgi:hypothetical protein
MTTALLISGFVWIGTEQDQVTITINKCWIAISQRHIPFGLPLLPISSVQCSNILAMMSRVYAAKAIRKERVVESKPVQPSLTRSYESCTKLRQNSNQNENVDKGKVSDLHHYEFHGVIDPHPNGLQRIRLCEFELARL